MKKEPEIMIEIGEQRIVTLPELYKEYDKTRRLQAGLSFEDKIKALVELQKMASSWGKRGDVIVWKV